MIEVGGALVSLDVLEKQFVCDLSKCKGICCEEGDAGAPVEDAEIEILQSQLEAVLPYMSPEGADAVKQNGCYYIDEEKDKVTTLINGKECAFTIYENGFAKCAIEKAFEEGKIDFQKPISCHLYPIRINKYPDFEAVNYDVWDICGDAVCLGKKLKVPVYRFLEAPLVRKYGKEWYRELCEIAEEFLKTQGLR